MELKIYTSSEMSYSNRKVFKNVTSLPDKTVTIKHFNYNDMINSSVVLDKSILIKPQDITYLIVLDEGQEYHYFVTTFQFLSKGKFQLTLYRNVWPDVDLKNTVGTIARGTTSGIANYKPNTMTVNNCKVKEVYITDDFTDQNNGVITKPSSWGILYTSKLDEGAENPNIELTTPPFVVSGETKYEGTFYRDLYLNPQQINGYPTKYQYIDIEDTAIVLGMHSVTYDGDNTNYKIAVGIYNVKYNLTTPHLTTSYTFRVFTEITKVAYVDSISKINTLLNSISETCMVFSMDARPESGLTVPQMMDKNFTASLLNEGSRLLYLEAARIKTSDITNEQTIINSFGKTINGNEYQSKDFVEEQNNTIVKVGTEYFNTTVLKSSESNILRDVEVTTPFYQTTNNLSPFSLSKSGILDYIKYIAPENNLTNFTARAEPSVPPNYISIVGTSDNDRVALNTKNGNVQYREIYTMLTQSYSYNRVGDFSVTIDKKKMNNGMMITQPYGIIAIPLFDVRYKTDVIHESTGTDNQKVFYGMINKYSGGDNPFIIDAQIIPYAPTIFKTNLKRDNGKYIDFSELTDIIATKTEDFSGAPLIMLDNADININKYIDLDPYIDVQKEYTLRNYRIQSPGQDAAWDFKYYDYNSNGTPFMEFIDGVATKVGDFRICVDITLKPFGLYMHASPYIRDGSLIANRDYDSINGLICGAAVFQSSLSSSAFETYKRQNSMYSDVQQRKIESLNINQDAERVNEVVTGVVGTLQATALGTLAGSSFGSTTISKTAGGVAGGAAAGIASGVAYGVQYKENEKLRNREVEDAKWFYNAELQTIKNLPNSVNRVSSLNQDILNHFCIYIEVFDATSEEIMLYDELVDMTGCNLNINGTISNYLTDTKYIQANIFRSDIKQDLIEALKNDLGKGVYYYEQI